MANTLWAFACVGWEQHQIFGELGSTFAARLDDLNEVDQSQLYHVALYMQVQWLMAIFRCRPLCNLFALLTRNVRRSRRNFNATYRR